MLEEQAIQVIDEINEYLQKELWFDFEAIEYQGSTLTVMGGIDTTVDPELEIYFHNVCFTSLPIDWMTDTDEPPLRLVRGDEANCLREKYRVGDGYHLFHFSPSDYPRDPGCLVFARGISFEIMKETA